MSLSATGISLGAVTQPGPIHRRPERRRSRIVAERVREAIWSMRGSDDVDDLLAAIGDNLHEFGIPFLYCGVNVIDTTDGETHVTAHSLRRDSRGFHLEGRGAEAILSFRSAGDIVYRRDLTVEDPYDEYERFQRNVRSVLDVPFSHGTLAVSSKEPEAFAPGDIDLLKTVAAWLSDGFRRLDDLRALEERNTELVREVAERRRAEEQLATSLEEKMVLLREIHHRVKNNLQVVSSLLSLQSFFTDDESARAGFRESRSRIESMALIHERLYESDDLASVDGGDYLRDLVDHLFSTYGVNREVIDLQVEAEPMPMDVDTAVHSGLIVNELVSNSLKYGFPEGRRGRVDVRLNHDGETTAILEIRDDGVGMETTSAGQLCGSMGMQLVADLTTQLDGHLVQEEGPGTTFRVRFPLAAATAKATP